MRVVCTDYPLFSVCVCADVVGFPVKRVKVKLIVFPTCTDVFAFVYFFGYRWSVRLGTRIIILKALFC